MPSYQYEWCVRQNCEFITQRTTNRAIAEKQLQLRGSQRAHTSTAVERVVHAEEAARHYCSERYGRETDMLLLVFRLYLVLVSF